MFCCIGKCSGECGDFPIANGGGAVKRSGTSINEGNYFIAMRR
jgi:hypothetical protein